MTAPIRSHLLGGRYQLDRVVGAGGFGTVFEARDTLLGATVAIKLLSRLDPREITDFKREFRAATALLHPNVVVLHELGWDASGWFISMDLVDGMDLGRWLTLETSSQLSATRTALEEPADEQASAAAPPAPSATPGRPSPRRSAGVFAQIADALAFLHQRAVVHGDLKPSNVVIGAGERPVLVDFGLAQSLTRTAHRLDGFRGTPAYAAPEAGTARALASSSDLYSLGVMMFEAWAGRLPFEGSAASIMRSKREARAPSLRELNEEVPSAVAALVDALLDPAAERRPDALVVMERLRDWISTGNDQVVRGTSSAPAPPPSRHGVLGRDEELSAILGALQADTRTVIFLAGESGIGKTRLASACAEAWGVSSGACVLTASCFERERGPFELLDGLGAAMLAAPGAQAVLRSHAAQVEALASLAPSLAATTRATLRGGLATADEREHAVEAAAQLLAAIAERAPVLLLIDDLQWADADSLWAVERVLTSPRLERVALLTTVRPGAATAEALAAALASTTEVRQVVLGPLADRVIDELSRSRFRGAHHASDLLEQIRRGCSGNPLLAVELADQVARGGEVGDASLDRLVGARLDALGPTARDLFELASAAGHPVDERDLVLVGRGEANATTDELVRGLSVLRQAALLDSVAAPRAGTFVRPRHARLAAAALDPLEKPARAALHARWAAALEKSANAADAEVIARHWLAGGAPERAPRFLLVAAQTALASYAFAKANELVSIGLRASRSNREKTALLVVLAEIHAAEGSGEAAARAFTLAARDLPSAEALDLERRAAEELLKAGRIGTGIAALDTVLERVGMRRARTRAGALVDLVAMRARVWWSERGFAASRPLDDSAARRADAAGSISKGLGFVDPIVAASFTARHYLEAARSGDPLRRLRGLSGEAVGAAGQGAPATRRVEALLFDADALADAIGTPRARVMALGARGIAMALLGRFEVTFRCCAEADALFTDHVRDAPWDHMTALHFYLWAALELGRLDEIALLAPPIFARAASRGDRYGATGAAANYANLAWLLRTPDEARRVLETCDSFWAGERYNLLAYDIDLARVNLDLSEGNGVAAARRADTTLAKLDRSLFLHVAAIRRDAAWMRARARIAAVAATSGAARAAWQARAAAAIRWLARCRVAHAPALARFAEACLLGAAGHHGRKKRALAAALPALERNGLVLVQRLAERALGASTAAVDARLVSPTLMSRIFAPGLTE